MNVETISMSKEEALSELKQYRSRIKNSIKSRMNQILLDEYKSAIDALVQLGKGYPILDIENVMRNAPVDSKERPRLAICRADQKQCHLYWREESEMLFFLEMGRSSWSNHGSLNISVNMNRRHHFTGLNISKSVMISKPLEGYALVPMIPPKIELKAAISNYFILWEVEGWADKQINSKPDKDPYLLRRINSTLFAIIAEWDLTELERTIMKGRNQ